MSKEGWWDGGESGLPREWCLDIESYVKERWEAESVLGVDTTEAAVDMYHLEGLEEAWRSRRAAAPGSRGFK